MKKATNKPSGERNDKRNASNNQKAKYSLLVRIGGASRKRRNKNRRELIALGHQELAAVKAAKEAKAAAKAKAKAKARSEGQARAEEQAALREARRAEAKALRAERHAHREAIRQARRAERPVTLRKASHNKQAIRAAAKAVRSLTTPALEGAAAFLKKAERVMINLAAKEQRLMEAFSQASEAANDYFFREIGKVVDRMASLQRLIINAQQSIEFNSIELGWGC